MGGKYLQEHNEVPKSLAFGELGIHHGNNLLGVLYARCWPAIRWGPA